MEQFRKKTRLNFCYSVLILSDTTLTIIGLFEASASKKMY